MRVLVCGGGVIGASIAYFLSRRGSKPIVIEHTGLACAASGKSGGFLALDWCDGTPLQSLARRSFTLHASLAAELDGDWATPRPNTFSDSIARSSNRMRLRAGFRPTGSPAPFMSWMRRSAGNTGCHSGISARATALLRRHHPRSDLRHLLEVVMTRTRADRSTIRPWRGSAMAGYATLESSAGHPSRGAPTRHAPTFDRDHLKGAGYHAASAEPLGMSGWVRLG